MNTINTDDDEELLLLRIKALKSTPRVNIRVEFSSDNDSKDVSVIDIKKKKQERKIKTLPGSQIESSPLNADNDESEESILREIALRSLRRSSSSSSRKSLGNRDENHSLVHVAVDGVPTATGDDSCRDVTSGAVIRIKESSAIQHDLISSTSGESSQTSAGNTFEENDQTIETLCTLSKSTIKPASILSDSNVKSTCIESVISITCTQLTLAEKKSNIVYNNPSSNAEALTQSTHVNTPLKTSKEITGNSTVENSNHIVTMGNTSLKALKDIHMLQLQDNPFTRNEKLHKKSVIHNKMLQDDILKEKLSSSTVECDYGTLKSPCLDLVIERTSPLATPNYEACELGEYSPSSPSEIDEEEIEEENNKEEHDDEGDKESCDVFDDDCNEAFDAISLCTSEKDENELDSISFEYNTYTTSKQEDRKPDVNRNCNFLKHEKEENTQTAAVRNSQRNIIKLNGTLCSPTSEANTETDSDLGHKTDQYHEISNKIYNTDTCSMEKDIHSDASGLNRVLDRYLDEVAANKKNSQLVKRNSNVSCTEQWIDCEPGPSGYVAPNLIHAYKSDSGDSLTETTSLSIMKPCNTGLVSSEGESTGRALICNSTVEDIKSSLEGQNIHDDGKREDLKDVTCAICLGPFENRSFLNLCFHSFCHMCIIQWSELSRLCPLCKTKYVTLIHSVNTDLDYETYEFPDELPEEEDLPPQRREFSETMEDGRRFRYRSTVVNSDTLAARRTERERAEHHDSAQQQRKMKRRIKWSATKDRRKDVYKKGLQIKEVKQRGKVKIRDISPQFFEKNPALKHRLVPWLLRDLNVLLGNKDEDIRFVMALILNLISKVPLGGDVFREQLCPFLFDKTGQFVTELVSFASSPYDIQGYDENVRYEKPETDVVITSTYFTVSDSELPADNQENRLLNEILIGSEPEQCVLGGGEGDTIFQNISPPDSSNEDGDDEVQQMDINSVSILPIEVIHNIETDEFAHTREIQVVVAEENDIAVDNPAVPVGTEKAAVDVDAAKETSNDEQSDTDDSSDEEDRKRRKHAKKGKKRKRKRKHTDGGKAGHKKRKSRKRVLPKSGDKAPNTVETSLPNDSQGDTQENKEKKPASQEGEITADNEGVENKNTADTSLQTTSKPEKAEKTSNRNTKKKRSEQKKKHKHKKTKHEKHKKRKRKNSSELLSGDSSSDEESEAEKKGVDSEKETPRNNKHDTEEIKTPQKTSKHKNTTMDNNEERTEKKSLKRKNNSSTEHLPKRKKKVNDNKNDKNNSDLKTKRKKKDKKKKRKHKHRKSEEKKTQPLPSSPKINISLSEEALDKELQCKIEHAINAIMVTKGSDDDDEFINSKEVQDLLAKYKYNDKLDLIKDGDGYKTRAEVVHELLLIEKAITRRKEKKQKQKQINQNSKANSNSDKALVPSDNNISEKSTAEVNDKAMKKAEREKSYKVLFKELQEIEGRINSCRSSLQGKPSDLVENGR